MNKSHNSYSFLVVGKTQESTEAVDGFKRYIGLGSSFVLAVNPKKDELDSLMGFESATEPEYIKDGDNGKEVYLTFIVKTDPEVNNGIDVTNRLVIVLRNAPAYNSDKTKVQVIDDFGNHTWMNSDDAKAGKPALLSNGNPNKLDTKYRMACVGECDLVDFLKAYLCTEDAFNYVNGVWVKKENSAEYAFKLEHIKDYFNGDFSEIKEALEIRNGNKVKLLYGVRTNDEGKQYQTIASKGEFILRNSAGSKAIAKLEKDLANVKMAGMYANVEFKVQELAEYNVEATNLEKAPESSSDGSMPWD